MHGWGKNQRSTCERKALIRSKAAPSNGEGRAKARLSGLWTEPELAVNALWLKTTIETYFNRLVFFQYKYFLRMKRNESEDECTALAPIYNRNWLFPNTYPTGIAYPCEFAAF